MELLDPERAIRRLRVQYVASSSVMAPQHPSSNCRMSSAGAGNRGPSLINRAIGGSGQV
jgi:hypothetical protein